MSKKRNKKIWKYLIKIIWFIIKLPYYFIKITYLIIKKLIKGIYYLIKKISEIIKKKRINKEKKSKTPKYEEFKVLKKIEGDYNDLLYDLLKNESKIGLIIGSRGSGKTAFGMKLLENIYAKNKKNCFAIGFNENELPSWIKSISNISQIENNSIILIDESGILFNSRNAMTNSNKLLSKLILISRHKNLSIIFISQNSSNLEINVLRQADFIALKQSSLLQKNFERKIIQKIYEETEDEFKKYKKNKYITYIYSNNFKGFILNPLPSFWKESLSKSFK
ncbi:MAG TPA: zonular occludens toxin domain-containing protein [Candidatus Paceibacterota bacterium]|nr:zonular occludens toxin domain-containing protein [Candidatus Paceibacterota bacterium]